MGAIDPGLRRQNRKALQACPHLRRITLEQSSTSHGEKGVADKGDGVCCVKISDVPQGVPPAIDHLETGLAQGDDIAASHHPVDRRNAAHLLRADNGRARRRLNRRISPRVVRMPVRIEDHIEAPAGSLESLQHSLSIRGIDAGGEAARLILEDKAVIIREAGELANVEGHGKEWSFDRKAITLIASGQPHKRGETDVRSAPYIKTCALAAGVTMRQGIFDLRAFYASPLGAVARRMISRKVAEAWPDGGALDFLALGYATPFLDAFGATDRRTVAAMPAAQGVEAWPAGVQNRACLTDETRLPFPNAFFDRILAVHALEESDNALAMLEEIRRVLSPSGRVILAVAERRGLWADVETSPFGHGRPFSRRQLERLVREAQLTPLGWTRALYAPPLSWTARWAEGFEQVGARIWPGYAGVILMEVAKQTYALRPKGHPARVPVRARPVFAPARVSGAAAVSDRASKGKGPTRLASSQGRGKV